MRVKDKGQTVGGRTGHSIEDRLAEIEQRLAELEDGDRRSSTTGTGPVTVELDAERFWVLDGVRARHRDGGIVFAGSVETSIGEQFLWQHGASTEEVIDSDWSDSAPSLAALGHPVRLRILQYVLLGLRTTGELTDVAEVNTTGQLHHHLKDLVAARWLHSPSRGRYEIPADRVVPLLVILRAARPS